jgi:calcineurin-like phosphoesterase family protein
VTTVTHRRKGGLLALVMILLFAPGSIPGTTDRPLRSLVATLNPGAGPSEVRFLVSGDSRPTMTGAPVPRVAKTIAEEIGLIRPDFVLWTGDTVYGYGDTAAELRDEYARFFALVKDTCVPIFSCPGNHDIHSDDETPCDPRTHASEDEFVKQYGNLYGSFDDGDIHVISLDTAVRCHEDRIDGAQLAWLKDDLEANKHARMIFVFSHTAFFSSPLIDDRQRADHPPVANRDDLHALFRQYPVRAVFSGHEHLYWRESHDAIDYIVMGGGGSPVYAPPDRQGFSGYLLVTVSGSKVAYDVIEPGRLFQEDGGTDRSGEVRSWIVNSNDADIALRGVRVKVPGASSACADLVPEARVTSWDRSTAPVDVNLLSCVPAGGGLDVTLGLKAPRGKSVEVSLKKRTTPR